MSANTVAAMQSLVTKHPLLAALLDEHLSDNRGELLPHLFMADVVRWLVAHRLEYPEEVESIVLWMEESFLSGGEDVRGVIAVSGVEMIPDPGDPGSELRGLLGPALQAIDPWRDA